MWQITQMDESSYAADSADECNTPCSIGGVDTVPPQKSEDNCQKKNGSKKKPSLNCLQIFHSAELIQIQFQ